MSLIRYHWIPAKSFRAGRTRGIATILLHSSDGHMKGDIQTLTEGPVSAHWYITKTGDTYHFVNNSDTAFHAGITDTTAHSNAGSIGIEQEHMDGMEEWPDALILATSNLVALLRQKYGDLPALSHAEVARPKGRKQDPKDYPWDLFSNLVHKAMETTWVAEQI